MWMPVAVLAGWVSVSLNKDSELAIYIVSIVHRDRFYTISIGMVEYKSLPLQLQYHFGNYTEK